MNGQLVCEPSKTAALEALKDSQLLDRFIGDGEEAAFRALVQRHGPMVHDVCRRVTRHAQDAEDAFQATFLVLARKAASLERPDLVGNWLYGVAYRVAVKARDRRARRAAHERQAVMTSTTADPTLDVAWRELRRLLDEELNQLPAKYRAPLVLCYLEGKTHEEAAQMLHVPAGSMSWRINRGRELLRKRLTRRGLALSIALLALLLSQSEAAADVPEALVESTVSWATMAAAGKTAKAGIPPSVAALTAAMLKDLSALSPKVAAAILVGVAVLSLGGLGLVYKGMAAEAKNHAGAGQVLPIQEGPSSPSAGGACHAPPPNDQSHP